MTVERLRTVFAVDAALSTVLAVIFLLGTWDGLYDDVLDLPQRQPAIFVQIGGAALGGVAYLLWLAIRTPALMLPVARAAGFINGLAAGIVIAWLINGEHEAGTQGKIELIAAAALMVAFAVIYTAAGLRPGGYGPEPPPPPNV